jgi:hypothetical protein
MAMTECKECHKEVSDSAAICPHCGKRQRMHRGWWFLIVPAGCFALLLVIGFSIPKHVSEANALRSICMDAVGGPMSGRAAECDRIHAERMQRK